MARTGMIEAEGTVDKLQGGGFYGVTLDEEHNSKVIRAKLGGKLKRYKIRVLPGDRVRVELSPSDITLGLIVYRIS